MCKLESKIELELFQNVRLDLAIITGLLPKLLKHSTHHTLACTLKPSILHYSSHSKHNPTKENRWI